ncbi:unnamed protein product [Lymnaea stagnalis]|uniref:SOCS box domain-containing protein n=1 Tax=Lymnaea stagnalis TaxID=6523 RepID=A0AAV2I9P5_LYMST
MKVCFFCNSNFVTVNLNVYISAMNSILLAVQSKNTKALTTLLNGHTSVPDLEKALIYSSREGYTDCVKCILKTGTSPNIRDASDNTPLYLAVLGGHHDIVKDLCECGATLDSIGSSNSTALHAAAKWGKDECVDILLAHGCSLNASDSSGNTALILAVRGKHYLAIRSLLDAGCDVNRTDDTGRTALHYASHTAVAVEQLIKAGADVNIQDKDGCTPLMMAATEGLDRVIHALCQVKGVDANKANHGAGKTPLHILAYKGHRSCVSDLISVGADINLLDCDRKSPLWYAVANARLGIVALLLRANGLVDTYQCPPGQLHDSCPVKLAVELKLIQVLKLFIISGYDINHLREFLGHPEIHVLFADNQVSHWLDHAHQVMTLRQICRRWIRHHLGFRLFMDISKLPLPQKLLDFISMKELEETLTTP